MQRFRRFFSAPGTHFSSKELSMHLFGCIPFAASAHALSYPAGGNSTIFPVAAPYSHNFLLIALYLLLIGAVLSAGISNLLLYLSRKKERAHLYLSITCLAVGTDVLLWLISTAPESFVSPDLHRHLFSRLDFLAITVAVGSSVLLMRSLYFRDYSRRFTAGVAAASLLLLPVIPWLPIKAMNRVFIGFIALVGVFIVYSLYVVILAVKRGRPSSLLFASACFTVFGAGAIDALMVFRLLPPIPAMLPFGLAAFTHIIWFAVGQRYNHALLQTEKLNAELGRKARTEQHLRMIQRRLAEFLDKVPLPVCAVDENGIVQFVNAPAAEHFSRETPVITGRSIDDFLLPAPDSSGIVVPVGEQCRSLDLSDRREIDTRPVNGNDNAPPKRLEMVPLVLEDEELTILIIHDSRSELSGQSNVGPLIAELNRNRERLQQLDKLVEVGTNAALLQELRAVSSGLEHLSRAILPSGSQDDRRELAREIMTLSVAYWEACTGESRIELLRESGLWRVETTPDGFERSKTLERYLDPRLFPRNPRWKKVLATGDFVLSRCDTPSEERARLEAAMSRLRLS
jgi:PAS domain-containing protein